MKNGIGKEIETIETAFLKELQTAVEKEAQVSLSTLGVDFMSERSVDDQMIGLNIRMQSDVFQHEDPSLPPDSALSIFKNEVMEYQIWIKYERLGNSNNLAARIENLITSKLTN